MKGKAKREGLQIEQFLRSLQKENPKEFAELNKSLLNYEQGGIEAKEVKSSLVKTIGGKTVFLQFLNHFFKESEKLKVISNSGVQQFYEFMLKELSNVRELKSSLNEFIDIFHNIIVTKLDMVSFLSSRDLAAITVEEVRNSQAINALNPLFTPTLEQIMKEYVSSISDDDKHLTALEPSLDLIAIKQKSVLRNPTKPSTSISVECKVNNKLTKNEKINQQHFINTNDSEKQVENITCNQNDNFIENSLTKAQIQEMTKTDKGLFMLLSSQLSSNQYLFLVKNILLYKENIISLLEFAEVSENILKGLNKQILLALRDSLEGRETPRGLHNSFNIRLKHCQADFLENPSYKRILASDFEAKVLGENDLLNKAYFSTAVGSEAEVKYEEGQNKLFPKYPAEEVLCKVEDELHELDSSIQQLTYFIRLVSELQNANFHKKDKICKKILNFQLIELLFPLGVETLLNKACQGCLDSFNYLKSGLISKRELLINTKKEFETKRWRATQINNFYKSLDTKTNAIKWSEKQLLSSKNIFNRVAKLNFKGVFPFSMETISHLSLTEISCSGVPCFKTELDREQSPICSPILFFDFSDKDILTDCLSIFSAFVQQSKLNVIDRDKASNFSCQLVSSFLDIEPSIPKLCGHLDFCSTADLLFDKIQLFEKTLHPTRDFLYSEKLNFKEQLNRSNLSKDLKLKLKSYRSDFWNTPKYQQTSKEEDSDYSSEFNNMFKSGTNLDSQFPSSNIQHPTTESFHNTFFSSSQVLFSYHYFYFIYERLLLVKNFELQTKNSHLYSLVITLLLQNLFNYLESNLLEDILRTLLGSRAGLLMQLDKAFSLLVKNLPSEDSFNFISPKNQVSNKAKNCEDSNLEVAICKAVVKLQNSQSLVNAKTNKVTHHLLKGIKDYQKLELLAIQWSTLNKQLTVSAINIVKDFPTKKMSLFQQAKLLESYFTIDKPFINKPTITRNRISQILDINKNEFKQFKYSQEDILVRKRPTHKSNSLQSKANLFSKKKKERLLAIN